MRQRNLLTGCLKITVYNHPATVESAPFFRALVVSATKFTRRKEPTTSSNHLHPPYGYRWKPGGAFSTEEISVTTKRNRAPSGP